MKLATKRDSTVLYICSLIASTLCILGSIKWLSWMSLYTACVAYAKGISPLYINNSLKKFNFAKSSKTKILQNKTNSRKYFSPKLQNEFIIVLISYGVFLQSQILEPQEINPKYA